MSKVKFSENLFIGVSELNRFQKFLEDDGYKRQALLNVDKFGLINQALIPEIEEISRQDNFYVSRAGTPSNEIIVNAGLALDKNANIIINQNAKNLVVPSDSNWYWVKIKHLFNSKEQGKISVDSLGNVTGTDTKFTEVLRGQPNFPTKIKFNNSTLGNADEYEVVSVSDNDSLILQGDFIPESDLSYSVIGTFTPGFVVSSDNKNIYKYDDCSITLELELLLNVQPDNIQDEEFYIARVKNNGSSLVVEDKRTEWCLGESENSLKDLDRVNENPLIGVENVKWDIKQSTRDKNWVELSWGFRTNSWNLGTSSKSLTILAGSGGVYKDTSLFNESDFNGWRVYAKDGSYQNIVESTTDGTYINLLLDVLNPEDYTPGDLLFIAPPYESIEIRVKGGAIPFPNLEHLFRYDINNPICRFLIPSLTGSYDYNFSYRYKIFNDYSDWLQFPDDEIGFFKETSFDDFGIIKPVESDRVRNPYNGSLTLGFITIVEAPRSFDNFQEYVDNGDLLGVNTTAFAAANNVINLQVTKDKKYQHFKGIDDTPITLTTDIFINLRKFKDDFNTVPCRESNTFIIHITQFLNLDTFKLRIVDNFVNSSSYDLVAEITKNDINYIKNNSEVVRKGLFITCTFNESNKWIASYDTDTTPNGSVRLQTQVPTNYFDSNGDGQVPGFYGWSIMQEMLDAFPMGTNAPDLAGEDGGSNSVTLVEQNIPKHKHRFSFEVESQTEGSIGNRIQGTDKNPLGGTYSGETEFYGGETNGTTRPFDNRPKFYKFLYLIKK